MSGTSLDGLDIASCLFTRHDGRWLYEIEEAECVKYSGEWTDRLQHAPSLDGYALTLLDAEYGFFIGEKVNEFCRARNLNPDLIASHGHTIFHNPAEHISLQVGKGSAINAVTGIPVVSDFRSVDVSAGGQGAPLVPIADKLLFGEYDFCLNLGGIANISYDEGDVRLAYDVCPCNLVLNRLAAMDGKEYDEGGEMARSGKHNMPLLIELASWDYYKKEPPKSLDKDQLLSEIMPIIERADISLNDKIRTVVELIVVQVSNASCRPGKMLVTGGGAFNTFLVERIRTMSMPNVIAPDEKIVAYKEALAFAFLGLLRVMNEPNGLKSVTGARENTVGGALYGDFSRLPL